MTNRCHCDGVHHLLMELRIAFGRSQAVLCKEIRVVQINGRVEHLARGIVIYDFDVLADRSGLEQVRPQPTFNFPGHLHYQLIDVHSIQLCRQAGIKGKHTQTPKGRLVSTITGGFHDAVLRFSVSILR